MLKKMLPVVLVLLITLCFTEVFADVKEVTLYSGVDYTGITARLTPGDYILHQFNTAEIKEGKVLSIKVPEGYTVKVFNSGNFTGRWITLNSDVKNLSELFKYRIGSIRISSKTFDPFTQTGSGINAIVFNDEVATILPQMILFGDRELKGPHIHIFGPVSDLSDYEFDDQLSSFVVISGRWTFYQNKNYNAPCNITFERGIYWDVTQEGIPNDTISSLVCEM